MREPLVHFLLVGAALLAAHHAVAPVRAGDDSLDRIAITPVQLSAMREEFRRAKGRSPDVAETQDLLNRWIDEEVLYREALRRGLDREDLIVRRQLQQKMRFVLEDLAPQAEPTPEELVAWLAQHPERFARPARLSLQQIFLSRAKHGAQLQDDAERLQLELARAQADFRRVGDPLPAGAALNQVTAQELTRHFGKAIADAAQTLPLDEWSAPIPSGLGLHLIRMTAREPAQALTVAEAGEHLVTEYRVWRAAQANRQALAKLRASYRIELPEPGA
jgi:hypothetical protein